MRMNINYRTVWVIVCVLAVALTIPLCLNDYWIGVIIFFLMVGYMSSCWNIFGGLAGQASFGHAAFFGCGAYTTTLLYTELNVNPILGSVAGMLLASIMALILGIVVFRAKLMAIFLALVTFAFAEIVYWIINSSSWSGGHAGIDIPFVRGGNPTNLIFTSSLSYYYMILIMMIGILLFTKWIAGQKMGWYLSAVRENEDWAQALGINAFRYKIAALVISAATMALAGSFFALYYRYFSPVDALGWQKSFLAFLPALVGGTRYTLGPLIGSLIYVGGTEVLRNIFGTSIPGLNLAVFGGVLIIVTMFAPIGVAGLVEKAVHKVSSLRGSEGPEIEVFRGKADRDYT